MRKSSALSFIVMLVAAATLSCGAKKEIEKTVDCQSICKRYSDCFDSSYDVSGCRDRCEKSVSDGSIDFQTVDECKSCIDDRSCASGTLNCTTECVGVVP